MMLRFVLTQLLRQTARRKMSEAVSSAVRQVAGGETQRPADAELPPCDIAVVFATNLESEDFARQLEGRTTTRCASFVEHAGKIQQRGIVVAETGTGSAAAKRATADLIAVHRPAWVVSAGFAAALSADLRRGHVLMADEVVDAQGHRLQIGVHVDPAMLAAHRHLHVGRLLTAETLLPTPEQKTAAGQLHAALAYDMETMAVAEVCRDLKTRCLSIRVISDTRDDRLPPELQRMISQGSLASKLGAATGALFKRPASVKVWWQFQQQGLEASQRLAKFLSGAVLQLPLAQRVDG